MRDLIDLGSQGIVAPHEMQATVNDAQLPALQPKQPVAISVRKPGCLQPQAAFQHLGSSVMSASGRAQQEQAKTKRSMPPNTFCQQLCERLWIGHAQ